MSKKEAQFEIWKQKEIERMRIIQQEELSNIVNQIKKQHAVQQEKYESDWQIKEKSIEECFSKIGNVICDYQKANAERQELEKQLQTLEAENDQLKAVPVDNARQGRLVNIRALKQEIEQLEDELTKSDAQLRTLNDDKNRYKRLYLSATKALQEMMEVQKRRSRKSRK